MKKRLAISDQRSASYPLAPGSAGGCSAGGTRRAFTLTELMVAVGVLIIVIIATSKIFGTASQITGMGQATASMMQEAAAIEKQLRDDIAKLTSEGFFAIRGVAVQNDVKRLGPSGIPTAPLLDPNRSPKAIIRADQLVFFANGVESMQSFRLSAGSNHKAQSVASRIYYGHAFQLPNASGASIPNPAVNLVNAHDPNVSVFPWYSGNVAMRSTKFCTIAASSEGSDGDDIYGLGVGTQPGPITLNVSQPGASQWLLARQVITLVDDDTSLGTTNSKTVFLDNIQTARSIFLVDPAAGFSPEVRNGRVDAAASQLDDIRRRITFITQSSGLKRPWRDNTAVPDQRDIIAAAVYYPRAERRAPSYHRVDQALTNHVISSACSSFMVDWTYYEGVGDVDGDANGIIDPGVGFDMVGIHFPPEMIEQPWFGMPDLETFADGQGNLNPAAYRDPRRGTLPLYNGTEAPAGWISQLNPSAIHFDNIDRVGPATTPGGQVIPGVFWYEAFFGYNQSRPYWDESNQIATELPNPATGFRYLAGYTPWPSAIRITMTLHDPQNKLEQGREFQFVIDLPKRTGISR